MKSMKKVFALTILFAAFFLLGQLGGDAQVGGPRFMITWRAESLVPPGFSGKVLPTTNSPVFASFELVDGGRLVELSKYTVQWHLNDELIKSGLGIQTAEFLVPPFSGESVDLRVQLPNYKNNFIVKTVEIPVTSPEVVIEAPFPEGKFVTPSIQIKGLAFFFNAPSPSALSYSWTVNGESPANAENPATLNINLNPDAPLGSVLNIRLKVQNPTAELESANKSLNLIFGQ